MPRTATQKSDRRERKRPDRKRNRIREPSDVRGDVAEPRPLKVQEPINRPAISPTSRAEPVGRDEHGSKEEPAEAGKNKRPFPTRTHYKERTRASTPKSGEKQG